jgi:prepilin-type N-terminal cleavage/methylation domain-containing protein
MKRQKGFSLIELLIVVAIILIIAAIAIPNFMKSKMAANEASAVGSIRTINTSQVAFASACPNLGFTGTIGDFATGAATCPGASGLLDSQLVTGTKSGYTFTLASAGATPRSAYTINADPLAASSGTRYFFSDESNMIRYATGGAALVTSPTLQ